MLTEKRITDVGGKGEGRPCPFPGNKSSSIECLRYAILELGTILAT